MDMKSGPLFDWDGSSLVSEIDEDFADTFSPRHEDSKLEITSFQSNLTGTDPTKGQHKQRRLINTVVGLGDFVVRWYF
jgi:hypothetical protein